MKVALYLRRSTNDRLQADSLKVQEQILRAYADRNDMDVVEVFRDSASGTSTRERTAFLAMVETITHGATFAAVLVRDVSRFGRFFDVDEGAFFEVLFLGHGVKTVYCEEVFGSDLSPMGSLIKSVRRVMASEYSRDRSRLVRYAQSRATRLGFHAAGPPPYGMRRVMVRADGTPVQDLAPGEWKALSNHRTRLVAGDPHAVATVRRIFDLYDCKGRGVPAIVEILNGDGVVSPRGSRWYEPTVAAILGNTVYAGLGHYTPKRNGLCDPLPASQVEDLVVRDAAGHEAIISVAQFRRVEDRLRRLTSRRTNDDLATDARVAFAAHGCVEPAMLRHLSVHCSWATYSIRFPGGIDDALEQAYAKKINERTEEVVGALREAIDVERRDGVLVIAQTLRGQVQPMFPHRRRSGVFWRLLPCRTPVDVVLTFGIHANGVADSTVYVVRADQLTNRPRGLFLRLDGARTAARLCVGLDVLGAHVSSLRYRCGEASEARLIAAARESAVTNFSALARELNWPHHAVRKLYWRLVERGVWLPPLKYRAGRLLEIKCGTCGASRMERPNRALALRSNQCFRCAKTRPRHQVTLRCPACGREAKRWPSAVKKLSNGANTICRMCRVKAGIKKPRSATA
jgi:DNA invertase Pin-like site-specific DNA recombinase